MANSEFAALKQMAFHRGYKLLRSRKRTEGVGDFGKYALTDAKGARLLGFGVGVYTATAAEIADYLQSGKTSIWQQSVKITPRQKKAPAKVRSKSASPASPLKARAQDDLHEQSTAVKESPLVIRPARAADAQGLCRLLGDGGPEEASLFDIEQAMKTFPSKSSGIAVAEQETIMGVVAWSIIPTLDHGQIGRISLLKVDPPHRREGLGSQLLLSAESALRDLGCTLFEVASDFDSDGDNRLLRKQKYRQSGYRFVREPQ